MSKQTRMSLDLSPEMSTLLDDLAKRVGGSKSEVLRRALVLMDVAVEAREHGKKLLVVDAPQAIIKDSTVVTEIVGI